MGREDRDREIVRADKGYRKKFLILFFFFMLLGAALIQWVHLFGLEYIKRLGPRSAFLIPDVVLVLIMLSLVPFGIYFLRLGRKVITYECFPPPGTKVIQDTLVIRGEQAKRRGWMLIGFSILLILCGLAGALYVHYLLKLLFKQH